MKKKIKKFSFRSSIKWNAILFVAVIFASFILPVMPLLWQKSLAKLVYAIIYFSTILSIEKRSYNLLILFFLTFLLFLVSAIFNFDLLENISRGLNICLFLGIVILLLRQIIMAKDVSAKIIFDSIMGYLLLGVIFSIALLTVLTVSGVKLSDILLVCIPSTLIGVIIGILFVLKKGKELSEDPEFIEKMKDPAFAKNIDAEKDDTKITIKPGAVKSVIIFGIAVLCVVLLGSFPQLLPNFSDKEGFVQGFSVNDSGIVQMPSMIMMIMLAAAGLIILYANTTAAQVTKASLFSPAGQAAISVFGVIWMSSTFMNHNYVLIKSTIGDSVTNYPWTFALALFVLSILLFSQAATTKALMPPGLTLGMSPAFLLGIFPAVNGHFFIPGYPTLLTAIQFDRTGTTKIGKYVLNHSFMLPGMVTTIASVIVGLILQSFLI
jgi:anaerobic C4-dicarboxylate transporter-like protein